MTARRSEAGFTLMEMMVATAIMLTVTGAVFQLMNPAQGTFQAQPEAADMQQRMRVGVDTLTKDLIMAGAGTYLGSTGGALYNFMAPVLPYRSGDVNPAPGTFSNSTISIIYVPPTPSQTSISDPMPKKASELKVEAQANCPPKKADQLCGFKEGMRVMLFDSSGAWDPITITNVQDEALHLQYDGELSVAYQKGAQITQVATHTYYLKADNATKLYQLMHYDGQKTDLPVVDNVVKLEFEYFGEPQPPQLLPNVSLVAGSVGPWTTYGPKPPALGASGGHGWPNGENCLFLVNADGKHAPRLAVLDATASQVKLEPGILTDGPWCPTSTYAERFDADLLRIRRVRVKLRVQAGVDSLRGPAGVLFTRAGTSTSAERFLPDQEIRFDVTPRNMNLGR